MKAWLQWICFTLIAVAAGQSDEVKSISVKKCCQSGEVLADVLDKTKVQNPSCKKQDGKTLKTPKTNYVMKFF